MVGEPVEKLERAALQNPSGARIKGGWRRCRLLTAHCGDARRRRLAIHSLKLSRDPLQFFNRLSSWGGKARVLAPVELKRRVAEQARLILEGSGG